MIEMAYFVHCFPISKGDLCLSWQVSKDIFWMTFLRTVYGVGLFLNLLLGLLNLC